MIYHGAYASQAHFPPGAAPLPDFYVKEHTHKQLKEARAELQRLDEHWSLLKIRFASAGYPFSSAQDEMDRLENLPTTWNLLVPNPHLVRRMPKREHQDRG